MMCCAMLCMLCYDTICHAMPCYAMIRYATQWESASLRDWSFAARVARGGRAARIGRYATSATVERSA